jgi:hypothetical protein
MIYLLNCNWVATRWQQFSTHLHTCNKQNDTKQTKNRTQKFWTTQKHIGIGGSRRLQSAAGQLMAPHQVLLFVVSDCHQLICIRQFKYKYLRRWENVMCAANRQHFQTQISHTRTVIVMVMPSCNTHTHTHTISFSKSEIIFFSHKWRHIPSLASARIAEDLNPPKGSDVCVNVYRVFKTHLLQSHNPVSNSALLHSIIHHADETSA